MFTYHEHENKMNKITQSYKVNPSYLTPQPSRSFLGSNGMPAFLQAWMKVSRS